MAQRIAELVDDIVALLEAEERALEEERAAFGRLDARALLARATARGEFDARVRRLYAALTRALDELGGARGEAVSAALARLRAGAARLADAYEVNRVLCSRVTAAVGSTLRALTPTPYDRAGRSSKSTGYDGQPRAARVESRG